MPKFILNGAEQNSITVLKNDITIINIDVIDDLGEYIDADYYRLKLYTGNDRSLSVTAEISGSERFLDFADATSPSVTATGWNLLNYNATYYAFGSAISGSDILTGTLPSTITVK